MEEETESGRRLIAELLGEGFAIRVAFWAKMTESDDWYLYLASPFVDEKGQASSYLLIDRLLRKSPELGFDPIDVKVLRTDDSITERVLAKVKPRIQSGPISVSSPRPYPSLTRIGRFPLGGVSFDEARIYPIPREAAPA